MVFTNVTGRTGRFSFALLMCSSFTKVLSSTPSPSLNLLFHYLTRHGWSTTAMKASWWEPGTSFLRQSFLTQCPHPSPYGTIVLTRLHLFEHVHLDRRELHETQENGETNFSVPALQAFLQSQCEGLEWHQVQEGCWDFHIPYCTWEAELYACRY